MISGSAKFANSLCATTGKQRRSRAETALPTDVCRNCVPKRKSAVGENPSIKRSIFSRTRVVPALISRAARAWTARQQNSITTCATRDARGL